MTKSADTALPVSVLPSARLTGDGRAAVRVEFPCDGAVEGHVFMTVRQKRTGLATTARGELVTRTNRDGFATAVVTTAAHEEGPELRLGKARVEARVYLWLGSATCEYGVAARSVRLHW